MRLTWLRNGNIIAVLLLWFSILDAAGCNHKVFPTTGPGHDNFACGDQTVAVDPVQGTVPKAVYLCAGYTLTWIPNNHLFTVTFPNNYPFQGSPQVFKNDPNNINAPVPSPVAIYPGVLTVYSYTMTVDNKPITDPQVVGGGSHSPK